MFELHVLGAPVLASSNGARIDALARRPKRIALLAYLAVATPDRGRRRDKVLTLLWPESDTTHARASLSQALYGLRMVLGENAILSNGDGQLELNRSRVWCDAVAFDDALAEHRPAEALALYRADLLDGFFIGGAPEFEHWLDEARAELRLRAADAAWSLAEACAAEARTIEAERWARRAADLLPGDEAVVRRLMTFLYRLGDRAAAIRAYEAYVWRLTHDYELQPSADTELLAASIRQEQLPATNVTPPLLSVTQTSGPAATIMRKPRRGRQVSAVAAVAACAFGAVALSRDPPQSTPPVTRFALNFDGQPALAGGIAGTTIALSPGGDHLVYLGLGPNGEQLYLRPMNGLEAVAIPHTRGARHPFFSPDGEWLGFIDGAAIRKVTLAGGPAVTIAKVGINVTSASWGDNDIIVFATPSGLWQVPASGAEPTPLAISDTAHGERFRWPHVLPGGKAVVFTRVDSTGFQLAALSFAGRAVIPLGLPGTSPHFVEPDHLVYGLADGTLLSAEFDLTTVRTKSAAVPITEGVHSGIAGDIKLDVSRTGALAYVPEPGARNLVIADRVGRADTLRIGSHRFRSPGFSPDGAFLVTSILQRNGSQDLWVVDLARSTMRQITFDSGSVAAVWSADGRSIAYSSKPAGRHFGWAIKRVAADGTHKPESVVPPAVGQFPGSFTPDGTLLVFERVSPASARDIWIVPLQGERTPRPYLNRPFNEHAPRLSPDGRWLAFVSDESGRDEVYVVSFPRPGVPLQVSFKGGRRPRWAAGRELIYLTTNGLAAVTVLTSSPTLQVSSQRTLFASDPAEVLPTGEPYDVHPDGSRFVIMRSTPRAGDVMVLLNWFGNLRTARD